MASNLESTIYDILSCEYYGGGTSWQRSNVISIPRVYLEIPVNGQSFEIPTFAMRSYIDNFPNSNSIDAIVVALTTLGRLPRYKTLDRYMREILRQSYNNHKLVQLDVKRCDGVVRPYYGTHGAVFDSDLSPVAMFSWELEKRPTEEGHTGILLKTPILRISRKCFYNQDDAMLRFISKKFVNSVLEDRSNLSFYFPLEVRRYIIPVGMRKDVRVIIDNDFPNLKKASIPSISTTNDKLLEVAVNHIDEIVK